MKTTTTNEMTLANALRYARGADWDRETWNLARAAILGTGLCPCCACGGETGRLAPWAPGRDDEYAGRECYECGEFERCGPQRIESEYEFDCHSDADPGL